MSASHGDLRGRSEAVLAVTLVFLLLCTLFVGLRMVSRIAIVKKIAVDDYFIVAAWAIAVGMSSAICYGCVWGLGRHERNIPQEWQQNLRTADYVFSVLYQPALMTTKTSILAFYLALPASNKNFKWMCIATLFVVNAGGFALGLFTVFQCSPVGAAFEVPKPASSHCTDIITIYLSSTPLNIITDLALLFLPMPLLTSMRLPKKQKIILVITFSFGGFVAVVDVIRIVYLQSASMTRLREIAMGTAHHSLTTQDQTDFSWYASFSLMWSAIEVNLGIMVACVPGLKPLVSRFLPYILRDKGDATPKNASIVSMPSYNINAKAPPTMSSPSRSPNRHTYSTEEEEEDEHSDEPMGMMDFLTTPEMTELPQATRTQTAITNTTRDTPADRRASINFFDFVDMNNRKSLVQLTVRESVFPIAMVSVLFFIWGFEYGLLDVLNQQFQKVAHMTPGQSTGIHSAYFAGYLFGPPLVGRWVLKNWGFQACFPVGLSIYGCGTLIFWPAAVLTSFPAFVITNFIVAFGLSILEVAANPFIALCGPMQYSEMRLNFSQGVQAIGSVVAPLIANKAFIHKDAPSLVDTQWAYLGISLFTILLAVLFYYLPLPGATDRELEDAHERIDGANQTMIGKYRIVWFTLAIGVFAQFCYVGAQEVNGTSFDSYLGAIAPTYNGANYMAIAHTAFAVARFTAAGLGYFILPRILMLGFFLGAIVFEVLAMNFTGGTGTAMIIMVFFCEGPLFSLIFAQTLRGMGRHTKIASVFITSAVSGGSVFAPISNHIINADNRPTFALIVGAIVFAVGTVFPLWLNLSPLARKQCDPVAEVTVDGNEKPSSSSSRASRAITALHLRRQQRRDSTDPQWKEQKTYE